MRYRSRWVLACKPNSSSYLGLVRLILLVCVKNSLVSSLVGSFLVGVKITDSTGKGYPEDLGTKSFLHEHP